MIGQEIRFVLRQLAKTPGFTIAAIATLALGIGANTAMFTVLDGVLLRPLPYRGAERLVQIGEGANSAELKPTSWPNLEDLRKQAHSFEGIGGYMADVAILRGAQGGKTLLGPKLTCNLIRMLDARPLIGRSFEDADCARGAAPVVILSEPLWRQDFGADPHILGKQVRVGDVPTTVIGVMSSSFNFPEEERSAAAKGIWLPSRLTPDIERRGFTMYELIGRLRPGVSLSQAGAELGTVAANIRKQDPHDSARLTFTLAPYRDRVTNSVRPVFLALAAALGLVLLIACANVANLELSRYLSRDQELAVRVALGAPKLRLLRELMLEGFVLSALGALAGLALASAILRGLQLLPDDLIPLANAIHLRLDVLWALGGLAAVATLLSSLVPAMLAMRAEPQAVLRGAGRGLTTRVSRSRLAGLLIVGEVAIAAVLLVASSLLFRTLYHLEHKQLGFNVPGLITFSATPPTSSGYLGGPELNRSISGASAVQRYSEILERLRTLPGVERAALASSIPFDGVNINTSFDLNGKQKTPEERKRQHAMLRVASGDYLAAMRTPLVRGRAISDDDVAGRPFVAVVNETFARKFLGSGDPLGQQLSLGGKDTGMDLPYTIVGVMQDAVQKGTAQSIIPEMMLSYRQIPEHSLFYRLVVNSATSYVVRTRGNQDRSGSIRSLFRQVAPGFAVDNLQSMQKTVDGANFSERLSFYLTGSFAALAILLVIVGLYGVLAQLVSQRRQEIGVRVALGASRPSILKLVLRQGSVLIASGLLIGIALSLAISRTLASFLYEVRPVDLWSYLAAATVLVAVGLAAALIPARRAASIDPMEALRAE